MQGIFQEVQKSCTAENEKEIIPCEISSSERAVLANMIVKEEPVTFHWQLDQYEHFAIQVWGNWMTLL